MNRTELIARVSQSTGLSRRDAEAAFEHTIYEISAAVRSGDSVRITGFGTFRPRERKARQGRNPQTGAPVRIKASKGIAFSAGATLKSQLNARGAIPKPTTQASSAASSPAPARKAAASKTAASKTTARKAPAKRAAARKTTASKTTASKTTASKTTASKTTARKAPAKRAAVASKTTARKATKRR